MWAVALVSAWLFMGVLALILNLCLNTPMPSCPFHSLTTVPCPTCGMTRGTLAILHGHPITGWLFNPLAFTALALAAMDVLGRAIFRRRLRITLTPRHRRWAWAIVAAILLANWTWLIVYHSRHWVTSALPS